MEYTKLGNMELQAQNQNRNILIVYYSRTGNTRTVTEYIYQTVGGNSSSVELFEIKTVNPYPDEYRATTEVARRELDTDARPEFVSNVANMEQYDTIILGYPIWWGTMPMVFFTFLESHDLTGKTIIPFCTHGGSGLGRSVTDIRRLAPRATVLEGLAIRNANNSQNDVNAWLRRVGVVR